MLAALSVHFTMIMIADGAAIEPLNVTDCLSIPLQILGTPSDIHSVLHKLHLWLAALTIAAQVHSSDMVIRAECLQLVPPADPGLREAMQHEHERLACCLAQGCDMQPAKATKTSKWQQMQHEATEDHPDGMQQSARLSAWPAYILQCMSEDIDAWIIWDPSFQEGVAKVAPQLCKVSIY